MSYSEEEAITKKRKETIPRALREQVWIHTAKTQFSIKCPVHWCNNKITVFDFHVGHNIPEAKGGTLALQNLKPICARCNLSMGSRYTIDEWNHLVPEVSETRHGCSVWNWGRTWSKGNKVFPT